MKIALMGAQCTGKSTLVEEIIKKWPMYKRPQKTYRDIISEKQLPLNKQATKESQREILNALVDEAQFASASEDKHIIFDRCVVDNIAYSLWHYAKGTPGFDAEYIIDSKTIAAFALKHIDVIFYVPVRKEIPLINRKNRDIDEVFREEVDNILESLVTSYEKHTKAFFPTEDCPAVIRLDGPPDMRVHQIELYVKPNGSGYEEEDGSLIDPSTI